MKKLGYKIYSTLVVGLIVVFLNPVVCAERIIQNHKDGMIKYCGEKGVSCSLTTEGMWDPKSKKIITDNWADKTGKLANVVALCNLKNPALLCFTLQMRAQEPLAVDRGSLSQFLFYLQKKEKGMIIMVI